jgi:aminoglycoside 2'-N-acetyltransferase I
MAGVRAVTSAGLRPAEVAALRHLFDTAWEMRFTPEDWDHAFGGVHFLVEEDGAIVAHASIVPRELWTADRSLATGYVEAVAVRPDRQGLGHGTAVMREVTDHIDATYELGALDTGSHAFYERLGWVVWKGPTFVRADGGLFPTPEEDGNVLIRLTPRSPLLDLSAPISCEWRPGDVW